MYIISSFILHRFLHNPLQHPNSFMEVSEVIWLTFGKLITLSLITENKINVPQHSTDQYPCVLKSGNEK